MQANQTSLWPKPLVIEAKLPSVPAFDADALLPATLSTFVLDTAERMPCSPDFVAATLLVSLGSVIGARCALKPKRHDDGWLVPPNLWGALVAIPSAKKTPSMRAVLQNLDKLEDKEAVIFGASMRKYEADLAAFDGQGAPPTPPQQRRFKTNDATIEKLGDMLVSNPLGMLVLRDELPGLFASWEKDGHQGDKAFYLEAWNGLGSHNIDRIGRGSLRIPNLCLSVFGGIQPDLLERYLAELAHGVGNDGGIQRFQVMVFPEATDWEWRDRKPDECARIVVRALFEHLSNFDPVDQGATPPNEFVKVPCFGFNDEAQKIFVDWMGDLFRKQIGGEQNPLMQQHLAKFDKLFCSVALILHLTTGQKGPVTAETAQRAVAWCTYLAAHARRVYGLLDASHVTAAMTLGRRLMEGKLKSGFAARDVHRKKWMGLSDMRDVESALAILQENHWVVGHVAEGENGGRPTTRYLINPGIYDKAP